MDFTEVGVGNVGVDLGGADVRVTEEGLDGAKVGAINKKVGGERVAQGVRGNMFGDAGEARVFFNDALNRAGSKATVVAGGVGNAGVAAVVEEERLEGIVADAKVVFNMFGGGFRNENWAVFAAFTTDGELATLKVDAGAVKVAEFGDAEAAGEEQFNDGAVAEADFVGGVGGFYGFYETLDFI